MSSCFVNFLLKLRGSESFHHSHHESLGCAGDFGGGLSILYEPGVGAAVSRATHLQDFFPHAHASYPQSSGPYAEPSEELCSHGQNLYPLLDPDVNTRLGDWASKTSCVGDELESAAACPAQLFSWMKPQGSGRRRGRQTYSRFQTMELEKEFLYWPYLSRRTRAEVSSALALT